MGIRDLTMIKGVLDLGGDLDFEVNQRLLSFFLVFVYREISGTVTYSSEPGSALWVDPLGLHSDPDLSNGEHGRVIP